MFAACKICWSYIKPYFKSFPPTGLLPLFQTADAYIFNASSENPVRLFSMGGGANRIIYEGYKDSEMREQSPVG